jgi:exodeoxyribonuclease VII small subunit
MSAQPQADDLSFEQALVELEKIVTSLESGQAPLEDSITAYERGMTLKKHCEKKLNEAQEKIEKITIGTDGTPSATPFDDK